MNEFQQQRILHLAEKIVDLVYNEQKESYWGSGIQEDNSRKEGWINEEELNASKHNFKIVYNLNKLILKIKAEQL